MNFLPGVNEISNLHPMFAHFPIALILLAALAELLRVTMRSEFYGRAAGLLLNLAAVSAVIALYFGFRAADILGHDAPGHDQVHLHRDIMVWFTGINVIAALAFQFIKVLQRGFARLVVLFILSVLLLTGADRGADLVFNYGMGVHMIDPGTDHHSTVEGVGDLHIEDETAGKNKARSGEHPHSH